MFQSAENKVIVKFETKWISNMTSIARLSSIQNGSSIEPADYCNIICEVVSVPKSVSDARDYKGFSTSDIRIGDTAIVSHSVIYSFSQLEPEADPIYRNMVWYKGEEFFAADVRHIYATIRNDNIRMQNGYLMIGEMQKPPLIILSNVTKRSISAAQATLTHIGRPLTTERNIDVVPGDTIFYNPNKVVIYQVKGKPFGILRQKDVLGREIAPYKKISERY